MREDAFAQIWKTQCLRELDLQETKKKAYTDQKNDVFATIRTIANNTNTTLPNVCLMFLHKHIAALTLAVQRDSVDIDWVTEDGQEGFYQRIADARTWLMLLLGCVIERNGPSEWPYDTLPPYEKTIPQSDDIVFSQKFQWDPTHPHGRTDGGGGGGFIGGTTGGSGSSSGCVDNSNLPEPPRIIKRGC